MTTTTTTMGMTTTTELNTPGSALDTLRREAVALMAPDGGDANWVQVTEGLRWGHYTAEMSAAEIAAAATEDLAEAAEEWRAEQAQR
jgi:sugar phosphate isomerase/epimerase